MTAADLMYIYYKLPTAPFPLDPIPTLRWGGDGEKHDGSSKS